ncbi:MAG: GPR endopeptidase [Oscillospiraceae bacterium]|nr:GPR endopeptidase [Oscillospiraceae bacterium]MDE6131881.1 GPR endopeptidase [Oscillospiraceae bacterium]
MSKRTDLAVEMIDEEAASLPKGIKRKLRKSSACSITEIIVADSSAGRRIGKQKGRYITVETDRLSASPQDFDEQVENIATEISALKGEGSSALVVGLGNSDITPDALGPLVISQIIATRHLHKELPDGHDLKNLNKVSAIAPGVLGQTGIEAAEVVRSLCEAVEPDCVIVIDALACSDISRLGSTIQLTDSGISPGSGVQNRRKEFSEATLGVPVVAIGVPTVVDMHTIVENITGSPPDKHLPNMMVTPRDVDKLIERTARLLAYSINKAVQPMLTVEDITALS